MSIGEGGGLTGQAAERSSDARARWAVRHLSHWMLWLNRSSELLGSRDTPAA